MDTEEKLEELKKYKKAIAGNGGPGDEFEMHVYWLCEVAEGSYCISDEVQKTFWECVEKMLDDTLEVLRYNYILKEITITKLIKKGYDEN